MTTYRVYANACDFGSFTAASEQEARDLAAKMAGYLSEADMIEQLGQPSEMKVQEEA